MFTGIVEQIGTVKSLSRRKDIYRLEILPSKKAASLKEGDSLSINGACLTLVAIKEGVLSFDIMEETLKTTSFSHLGRNDVVNIERSLEWESRIDGHFVLGHIDSVEKIKSIEKYNRPYIDVAISPDDKIYVVKKGSIAIDGISLTIGELYEDRIRAHIIPYTLENTNLKHKKRGDAVNIEFDILGKYIENRALYKKDKSPSVTEGFLKSKGFI